MKIVEIQLAARARSAWRSAAITLVLSDAAKTPHRARSGYDPNYGARPLKRTIQKEVETPLGRKILAGEIEEGETVEVGFDDIRGELTFTAKKAVGKRGQEALSSRA